MREIIMKIADVFRDPGRIYQGRGDYDEQRPCCVGAHLANFFNVAQGYSLDFIDGAEMLGQELGANRAHLVLMLRSCGAPWDPFGGDAWDTPPREVFQKLAAIEETPQTAGADFSGVSFEKCNMGCAQLERCNLKFTDFTDAHLEQANLESADMEAARFISADLYGADLSKGYLAHAAFHMANLENANLSKGVRRGRLLRTCGPGRLRFRRRASVGLRLFRGVH